MQVKDIMFTSVKTVTLTTPLMEVLSLMCLYHYSSLPVLQHGKLIGTISENTIMARLLPKTDAARKRVNGIDFNRLMREYTGLVSLLHVADLMTSNSTYATPGMHALEAATQMTGKRMQHMPVVEDDKLVGMLSLRDVHKAIFHESVASNRSAA